jgi:hypothetical protein
MYLFALPWLVLRGGVIHYIPPVGPLSTHRETITNKASHHITYVCTYVPTLCIVKLTVTIIEAPYTYPCVPTMHMCMCLCVYICILSCNQPFGRPAGFEPFVFGLTHLDPLRLSSCVSQPFT